MKSIRMRKSLTGKDSIRSQISTPIPLPSVSKPNAAILPPQKVIRATADHRPNAPQELSFKKGDFFYVIKDIDDGSYYEAHNPVSGARGLVPRAMFEEFNKNTAALRTSQAVPNGFAPTRPDIPPSPKSPNKSQVFYAIVLHDFEAERADELDAKRGDTVTVVAQSNREWFVAKPIGKLGRPGLIPVSFVEIHDPTTGKPIPDVEALMDQGDLPKVEDWKRAMYTYKQNSIPLGVLDSPPSQEPVSYRYPEPPAPQGPSAQQQPYSQPPTPARNQTPDCLPEGILLSGDVVSFHYEMDEYWFRIDALFQPFAPPGQRLPPAKQLILFRVYNDFYDFQVALLDSFPREAGRQPPHPRMLPFMPGPAQNVDHVLTATRRAELDEYLHNLCDLGRAGCSHILEHHVVREFLALKPGDVDNATEPRVKEMEALFNPEFTEEDYPSQNGAGGYGAEVERSMSNLKMQDDDDGSDYEDEGYAPSPQRQTHDRHPYSQGSSSGDNNLRLHAHVQSHQRSGSGSSFQQNGYASNSRSNSPAPRSGSPMGNNDYNAQPRWTNHSANSQSTSSVRSSQAQSMGGRSRSQSTSNFNTPSISAANSQTAFVKIKIFDRVADDLVAIRVHPRVTHSELMEKVQARLGGEVVNLRYRDSVSNGFVGLDNDQDLRLWMESTDKHVLYAD
ncbi:scd2/ral3 [Mycena floridula]|nr:scd2/ral3 [Mycena floridula]